MKTYSYNAACAMLATVFGNSIEARGTYDRIMFYRNGRPLAQYRESTGHVAFTSEGKAAMKSTSYGRTIACYSDSLNYTKEG